MRKLIIGIVIVAIGVLCLSFASRISEGVFDSFFDNESSSSSGTGNGSSGIGSGSDNSSDGNSSSGEDTSDDLGTLIHFYSDGSSFGKNYMIDISSYTKEGNYYYYKIFDSDMYAKCDMIFDPDAECDFIVDCNSKIYLKSSVAKKETSDVTVVFSMPEILGFNFEMYFQKIGVSDGSSFFSDIITFSNYTSDCDSGTDYYYYVVAPGDIPGSTTHYYYYFIKCNYEPEHPSFYLPAGSPYYGLTSNYVEDTDEYVEPI